MTTPAVLLPPDEAESPVEPLAHQLLTALGQHRMGTTQQLHAMLRPDASRQYVSSTLNRLHEEDLVGYAVLPRSRMTRAWFLAPDGARAVRDLPALRGRPPYPITSRTAASLKTAHTLAVVRTHLAFAADARSRGDEHGYLDWTPETSHAIGEGERVTADAVMHYTRTGDGERRKLRAFVEVDRATMSSERVAAKLIAYARLWTYEPQAPGRRRTVSTGPGWLRWYPVFPRLLFVMTGANRTRLTGRIDDLRAMAGEHPTVAAFARQVPLGAAVLEDLEEVGADGPVWHPLGGGEPRPWTEL